MRAEWAAEMRLDKYLKVTGLIPRRTVAKEACDAGRVSLNGKPAKASQEVAVGDRLAFDLGRGSHLVEVLEIPVGNVSRERRSELYQRVREPSQPDGDDGCRPGLEGRS